MSEDEFILRDGDGKPIEIETSIFDDWAIKLLKILRKWFPNKNDT